MNLHDLVSDPKKLATFKTHISPQEAFERLKNGEKNPRLVEVVANDPEWACKYARYVLKGRFPAGEKAIAADRIWAYTYAAEVIKGRFPAGEVVFAAHPGYSYWYAVGIINDRFPAGEAAIASHPRFSKMYQDFLEKQENKKTTAFLPRLLKLWGRK